MADTPTTGNEPTVLHLTPVGQAVREAIAPPAPVLLPDGSTIVPETKPQSIQEAIRAARESIAAKQASEQAGEPAPAAEGATPATPAETPAPVEGEAPEGADAEDADGEGADGEVEDALVVELPARTPNGEPIRVAVPDQESLEAFQRLQNGYMRGEQAREVHAHSRGMRLPDVVARDAPALRLREVCVDPWIRHAPRSVTELSLHRIGHGVSSFFFIFDLSGRHQPKYAHAAPTMAAPAPKQTSGRR